LKGFDVMLPTFKKEVLDVAATFNRKLDPERSQQAAGYFLDKLSLAVESLHLQLPTLINQSKDKAAKADQLIIWLMNRIRMLEHFSANPFTTDTYLALVKNKLNSHDRSYLKALNAVPNEQLYEQILAWREIKASVEKVMPSMVLSEKTAAAIAEKLPPTLKLLSAIKGVGPHKAGQYGTELIGLIRNFQEPAKDQGSLF
jgi:superfamily II DNA helicase RecQ